MAMCVQRGREIRLMMFVGMALLCVQPHRSLAQEQAVLTNGQREYQHSCAVCHGQEGRGNGPMAELLKKAPPDLTQLRKKNGGQFPFWRVYRMVDGRAEVMAHGPRTMPVWGAHFLSEAGGGPLDEDRVLGRILSLVYYLESLQDKQRPGSQE
ncbi:MAG TPA: c-type cytochrome [Candidatus Binatia bacterium]|jgi:mono/diheme cytochrome c family protein|nr:c-type cytochrome [Candidatus Binatia bacterium]